MSEKVIWLMIFLALYWGYCLYQGLAGMRKSKTASDYFIAGRQLPLWVFVLAATAASFSGWTFMGHPSLVYRDGFQYAYASFYAITIPFTGVLFLKRQWMLGKRYGYVTPGEMLADYFQGDFIRVLTVIVAVLYSVPYLGVQFGAAGFLFSVVTDGLISKVFGMALFALVVLVYVASGGLRAVAYVQTMQCILLGLGICIVGVVALNTIGGLDALRDSLAWLGKSDISKWGRTEEGYNAYFAVPGVIQWTAGLGKETPVGGLWTGMMILTYMFALMGIQASPSFSMWSFSNTNPAPFAPQQVWASSFAIGIILFTFTAFQGMGAHFIGGNPLVNATGFPETLSAVQEFMAANNGALPLPESVAQKPDSIVPHIFNLLEKTAPWLIGILAICAFAAMESTGTAYASTCSGIVTRDLYKRYINPAAGHGAQKTFGRVSVAGIIVVALAVSTFSEDALVLLGGLAVAFGFQMFPSLAAATWFPWITRQGATLGLIAGLIGVTLTDSTGPALFGDALPWGRWPWTIHSAGWGILANVIVCAIVSMVTQNEAATQHRRSYHAFLQDHSGLPASKKGLVPVAWIITLAWFFFGIGPGAVIGNDIFGAPDAGVEGWTFGIPSIWAWQILFWGLGVFMMWFLAYKMEMSKIPSTDVQALVEDIGETALNKPA